MKLGFFRQTKAIGVVGSPSLLISAAAMSPTNTSLLGPWTRHHLRFWMSERQDVGGAAA